jgi:hypothetical protein
MKDKLKNAVASRASLMSFKEKLDSDSVKLGLNKKFNEEDDIDKDDVQPQQVDEPV